MKKIFTLCLLMAFMCVKGWGQTALSPTGAGGFELGSTFSANGWTEAQPGSARQWFVGSAPATYAGSYCAYIGSSTSYNGSANGSVMHFYRDIAIPAGATNVSLSFYYKQPTTDNTYDYFYVFTTTTANTPVVGTVPGTGYTQRFINTATTYTNWTAITPIDLTALAGTTVRLVFTHSNDGNSPYANPAVDNISLTYTPSSPTLTASPTTLTFGSSCLNTSPTVQSTTVTGSNLTGPVTIGGLTGYTYSTSSGGTYSNTLSLTPVSGAINQAVYVKFTPTAAQTYNGNIPISGGGATAINVGVTGTGVNSPPTVTSGTASSITYNSATVSGNLTAGCSATSAYGIEYSTTSGFANGAGTQASSSNLSGGAFSSNLTGLAANTTYYFHAYATNGGGTSYGVQGSFTTAALTYIDSWVSMSTGSNTWCAGEIRNVSITVKNTGTATWVSGSTGVNLSYYWSNQTRDANNRILPFTGAGLAPGQQQTITFPVTATSAGTYTLNFDLVKEQSCWFADNVSGCSGPGNVVFVSPSQTISQPITGLSYSTTTATYCTAAAITSNNPTVTGGTPTLYTVSPTLPAGLSINSTTGVISGTPTAATAAANYMVTASNGCGTKTATVNLTVITGVSGLTYTTASPNYCLNTAITSNAVSSVTGGGTITYSVNPALPAGLSINTNTGAITGTPTAVSAASAYIVTATNGCSNTTKALTITVNALPTGVSATATPATVCAGSSVALSSLPSSSSTLLLQNFNNGLGSWIKTNYSSGGTLANAEWTLRGDGYTYGGTTFHSNDNSQFLMSNSDAQGSSQDYTWTQLISPSFSTVGLTSCSLDFYQYFPNYSGFFDYDDEAAILISINGGSTWTTLEDYAVNYGTNPQGTATSFAHPTLTLNSYVGYSNVKIMFEYFAYYGSYWALDNINVTGGSSGAPFTYAWTSNPVGFTAATQNTTAAPTANTTYTVKVTNSNGCFASANAAVTVNPLPTATIAANAATACLNGTSPIITFTGGAGTAPYTFTYKINNGTNQTIASSGTSSSVSLPVSTATATSYTYSLVSVKDASTTTCSNTISNQSATIAIIALPAPTFITTPTAPYCVATNFDYATQAGQSSYVWTFSGTAGIDYQLVAGGTSTTSAARVKWLTAGSKTVTVSYTSNPGGCTAAAPASSTITVNALPTATISGTQTICNGGSANLTIAFTGISPWKVDYTNSVNTYTANSATTPAIVSVSPITTNTYYLGTSSVTDGSGCASGATNGSAVVTVNQKSANPTSASASLSTICSGSSTSLSLTGGGGGTGEVIKWYTGSCGGTLAGTGNNLSVSPTTATTYYGRYEDGSPCNYNSSCASVTIIVNTASIAPASASATVTSLCAGSPTVLSVTGGMLGTGATISWYSGSCGGTLVGTGNNLTVSPTATTTYYVRYEDGSPCTTSTACKSVTVTVNQPSTAPTSATASLPSICSGSSTTLTLNGGSAGTGASLRWYKGSCGGTFVGSGNNLPVMPSVTTTYYGRYEDPAPCNANTICQSVTVTVTTVPTAYNFTSGTLSSCANNPSVELVLSNSESDVSYQLYNNGTAVGTPIQGTGSSISFGYPTTSGQYYVVGKRGTCTTNMTGTANLTVTTISNYTVSGSGITCGNGMITLNGSQSGVIYQLVGPGTAPNQTGNGSALTFTVTQGGTYYVFASAGSCNQTMNSGAGIAITVNPVPSVTGSYTPFICSGSTFTVTPTSSVTGTIYTWGVPAYSGTGSAITGGIAQTTGQTNVSGTLSNNGINSGITTYTITPTAAGCSGSTFTVAVTVDATLANTIISATSPICSGQGTTVSFSGAANSKVYYTANGGSQQFVTLNSSGNYLLTVPSLTTTTTYVLESATSGTTGSSCSQSVSGSAQVVVYALPAVADITGPDYIAFGKTGSYSSTTTGGTWSIAPNGTGSTLGSSSANPTTVTAGTTAGAFILSYTVTGAGGCATTVTKTIQTFDNAITRYRTKQDGYATDPDIWSILNDNNVWVDANAYPGNSDNIEVRHNLSLLFADYDGTSNGIFKITDYDTVIGGVPTNVRGTVTIAATHFFQSQGSVDFNGRRVTLKSGTAGTAAIGVMTTPILNATNVQVERFTDGKPSANSTGSRRAWRLITSPVTGQSIHQSWQEDAASNVVPNAYGTLITGAGFVNAGDAAMQGYDYTGKNPGASIKRYDLATNTWVSLPGTGGTPGTLASLQSQPAFMLFVRGDRNIGSNTSTSSVATLRSTGELQQSNQPLTFTAGNKFILAGNPYASTINFEQFIAHNSTLIQDKFYSWNSTIGTYGAYILVTHTGTGANNGGYEATPDEMTGLPEQNKDKYKYIPNGSGFFVVPLTSSTSGTLGFQETDKAPGLVPPVNPFKVVSTPANVRQLLVNLNLKDSAATLADGFRAKFSPDYEGNEEDNSTAKIYNFNENLNLVNGGKAHIIEARGEVKKTDTLFMKMWYVIKRSYQLQMKGDNFATAPGIRAWLVDGYLGTKQELALGGSITTLNFEVNSDSASAKSDRFMIVFENNASVLPVTITKVKAAPSNGGVQVSWTAANEVNIKGYTIEKSGDGGRSFTDMGTQQPAHNNAQAAVTSYSGYDAQPKTGDNFYRIRIEGKDGSLSYSEVVKVTIGATGAGIQITLYPNPVREGKANLSLSNLKEGTYLVSVYTGSGQTVYQRKIYITLGGTTQTEPLILGSNIAQGSYQIKVSDNKGNILFNDQLIVAR